MSVQEPVGSLLPHQSESGLVTQSEMDLARRWAEAVGSESGPEWLDGWLAAGLPFSFRCGGVDSKDLLSRSDFDPGAWETDESGARRAFTWTDPATGLRAVCHVREFAAFPAFDWVLTFENTGDEDTPILEDMQPLDLRMNRSEGRTFRVYGAAGGRSFPDDMLPFAEDLSERGRVSHLELGGHYPSSNRHLPFFNISTLEGTGVAVGVGWSGYWLAKIDVAGTELRAQMGLMNARYVLRPGERVRTPRALVLPWAGKRLHGQNMLRRLLHTHYVPPLKGVHGVESKPQEPLTSVNVAFAYHEGGRSMFHGEGFLQDATEEPVRALVDPFIELGAELLIIDAGWYESAHWIHGLGNWTYSRSKYPDGFRSIADPLAASDVRFGLWFASEMVAKDTRLGRDHPEWIRTPESGRMGTLRMEIPEAREWFLDQVDELVRNEGMTCYRQDFAGTWWMDEPDRQGTDETRHLTGLYELWDTLLERHPNLVMEGCSGGGRRIDLESLSRFHWHQKSDRWFDSESDQVSLYGANLFLPGGLINIPTRRTDNYGAWSSFGGQLCLGWHPLDEDFPTAEAAEQVRRYKEIRPYLSGDFYPLTPCAMDAPWIGYQFHRADLDSGFALVFRRQLGDDVVHPVDDALTVMLRGLDPGARYRVRLESGSAVDSETRTGAELAQGLSATIEQAPGAEMLRYDPA